MEKSKVIFLTEATIVLVFIFAIGYLTSTDPGTLLESFMPVILYLIIAYFLLESSFKYRSLIYYLSPLVLVFIFLGISQNYPSGFSNLDVNKIVVLNLLICYMFAFSIDMIKNMRVPKQALKTPDELYQSKIATLAEEKISLAQTDVPIYIGIIEERSNKLNEIIGKVYSKENGVKSFVRAKVRIPMHPLTASKEESEKLRLALVTLRSNLEELNTTEKEMMPGQYHNIINVKHNPDGSSRIIDVLMDNHTEPALAYLDDAIERCNVLINHLTK